MKRSHTSAALTTSALALSLALGATGALAKPDRQTASRPAQQNADGVWIAAGDVTGDGRDDTGGRSGKLKQNGTTVATAGEVAAPQTPGTAMLLPAVQKVQPEQRPQRAPMEQNGTTVSTAGNVTAPRHN